MKLKSLKPRLITPSTKPRINGAVNQSWRDGRTSTQRGYGYKWQKARERFLFSNPLCIYCGRVGRATVATVVDHIIPHKGDQVVFWDESQWQALCSSCHSSIKQREEKQKIK